MSHRGGEGRHHPATDVHGKSVPVDTETGRPSEHGRAIFLDDFFATLLEATGRDPADHGCASGSILTGALKRS